MRDSTVKNAFELIIIKPKEEVKTNEKRKENLIRKLNQIGT